MSPQALPRAECRSSKSACAGLDGTKAMSLWRMAHSRLAGVRPDMGRPCGRTVPGARLAPLWVSLAEGHRVPQ